jgi:hypothetical protein
MIGTIDLFFKQLDFDRFFCATDDQIISLIIR